MGEDVIINVKTQKDATGTVTITINNIKEVINLVNGSATYTLSKVTAGVYNISAIYSGDDKYLASSNSTSFVVSKIDDYQIIVATPGIIAGENGIIYVSLPDGATGTITVKINNKTYVVNVTGDVTEIAIDPLEEGVVMITTTYSGDNKYASKVENGNITVVHNPKVNLDIENITMIYHDGTRLIAKLTDFRGKPIVNAP